MRALLFSFLWIIVPILTWAQTPNLSSRNGSYRQDSIVICGQILNRTTQTVPSIAQSHFITDELIETTIPVDTQGNFSVKVPAFGMTRLFIYQVANSGVISLFAEPGEKVYITADWKNKKVLFKGKYAREHQEVYDYDSYLGSINKLFTEINTEEKVSHEQYLQKLKRFTSESDSLMNAYMQQHPGVTKRAKEEIRIGNYNTFAMFLMQRRFALDRKNGEKFSKTYMKYADSIFAALPKPYTVASTTFLCDYLDYYGEIRQNPSAWSKAVIDYAIKNKRIVPNEEQKKDLSLILKSNEFQPILSEVYNELKDTEPFIRLLLDYYSGGVQVVPMSTELKEMVITQNYYKYLKDTRVALSDVNVEYYKQLVKNPELRKFVLDYQNKLSELGKGKLEYPGSLKDATSFKDCKTGEEVFSRLVAPHKGKIIYLDIWGTWCAPCKEEMTFVGPIKEAMKGKDIVFLYLANRSSDSALKNIIKENHLTGVQVEHYNLPSAQQSMVEDYLGVHSFPSYLVVDREGKIVNKDPMRPSRGQRLIDYLNELLSK